MSLIIPADQRGRRLDQVLAELLPEHSRARLQGWIRAGCIRLDDRQPRQKDIVQGGESLQIEVDTGEVVATDRPQDIPLNILYADSDLIILDKPAGLVVHPGAGNREHTLLNALLHHFPELAALPRAGIIQRLDKDTSGLMVIARSATAHTRLVADLAARAITREYQAVVTGVLTAGGTVDAAIGRHSVQRKRMAVTEQGKSAVTHYRVIQRFAAHTHVQLRLETGRTHQIRVHMAYIRHPVVGDPVYGGRPVFPKNAAAELLRCLESFPRQALHASRLVLTHPASQEELTFESGLPEDIQTLLDLLHAHGH